MQVIADKLFAKVSTAIDSLKFGKAVLPLPDCVETETARMNDSDDTIESGSRDGDDGYNAATNIINSQANARSHHHSRRKRDQKNLKSLE